MKYRHAACLAFTVLFGTSVAHAYGYRDGEASLARLLEGREAGTPLRCIPAGVTLDRKVIDHTAIVYRIGSTLYVNRPSNVAALRSFDTVKVASRSTTTCRDDVVQTFDRTDGMMWQDSGRMGDFVPYPKPESGSVHVE